jgi:hypothetical protein
LATASEATSYSTELAQQDKDLHRSVLISPQKKDVVKESSQRANALFIFIREIRKVYDLFEKIEGVLGIVIIPLKFESGMWYRGRYEVAGGINFEVVVILPWA